MSTTRKNPSRKPTSPKVPQTTTPAVINVEGKFDERRADIIADLIAVIKSSEERGMQQIGESEAVIANLKRSITVIEKSVTAVDNSYAAVQTIGGVIDAVRAQPTEIQSSAVVTDVIINGILPTTDESLSDILTKVRNAAQHKTPQLHNTFRQLSKSKKNNNHAPIQE